MSKEAAREIGHLLQGYAQLLAKVELALDDPVLLIDTKLETDKCKQSRSLIELGAWFIFLFPFGCAIPVCIVVQCHKLSCRVYL